MSDDALDVNKINVNPGGKQRCMRDGCWNGQVQKMVTSSGVSKGLHSVLEERGVNTHGMNEIRKVLGERPDFKI